MIRTRQPLLAVQPPRIRADMLQACVIPRPIGWISTVSPTPHGSPPIYNLAPYSQFNNLTFDPPYVMFASNQTLPPSEINPDTTSSPAATQPTSTSSNQRSPGYHHKDTVHNAESTGYFCWQLATYPLRSAVNASAEALTYNVDEFERAKLEKTWSEMYAMFLPQSQSQLSQAKQTQQLSHFTLPMAHNPLILLPPNTTNHKTTIPDSPSKSQWSPPPP